MKLAKLFLADISEEIDPFAIKNFIISEQKVTPMLSPDYPFILDGVAFIICIKGSGLFRINFREYNVEENTIITILPFFVTELIEKSDDLVMEFLIFSIDFLIEIPSRLNFDVAQGITQLPCIKATQKEAEELIYFHSFIVKQYKRTEHPFRSEMAKGLLYALLTEIGSIYYNRMVGEGNKEKLGLSSHQEELVGKFFELLATHHRQEKTLQFYADKMCLTSKYLSTVIKNRTGRSGFSWINEALISSAKYLLKTTDMTILQISEDLNFPNPSFFGRFFKKHTKMTPVQYRQS